MIRFILLIAAIGLVGCRTNPNRGTQLELVQEEGVVIEKQTRRVYTQERPNYAIQDNYENGRITPSGAVHSRSIGEIIYVAYDGKWQKSYVLKEAFSFGYARRSRDGSTIGSIFAPKGSIWTDRYRDKDGAIFLTSSTVKRNGYAVKIDDAGKLTAPFRAYRIDRGPSIKQFYQVFNSPIGQAFECIGMILRSGSRASGWGIYYLGQMNGRLRFKIYELNSRGDQCKDVVYEHNFEKSKDMIVRGVTFKIEELKDNGVISYRVIE